MKYYIYQHTKLFHVHFVPKFTTKQVIDHVNTIRSNQGMPTGLKIENRYKTTLYASYWIAGVDYADTNDK